MTAASSAATLRRPSSVPSIPFAAGTYGIAWMLVTLLILATLPPGGWWGALAIAASAIAGVGGLWVTFFRTKVDARASLDQVRTALDQRSNQITAAFSAEVQDLRDELRQANDRADTYRKELTNLQNVVYDLRERVLILTNDNAGKTDMIARLNEEVGKLRQELKVKEEELVAYRNREEVSRRMIDDLLRAVAASTGPAGAGPATAPLPA